MDTKLQEKSCYYFLRMYMKKKKYAETQDRRNFESVRALFVICTRVTT